MPKRSSSGSRGSGAAPGLTHGVSGFVEGGALPAALPRGRVHHAFQAPHISLQASGRLSVPRRWAPTPQLVHKHACWQPLQDHHHHHHRQPSQPTWRLLSCRVRYRV